MQSGRFELRILRRTVKEPVGRVEHMVIGGYNPYRVRNVDRLQYRIVGDAEWQDVLIVMDEQEPHR